jgi:hypothetical protein
MHPLSIFILHMNSFPRLLVGWSEFPGCTVRQSLLFSPFDSEAPVNFDIWGIWTFLQIASMIRFASRAPASVFWDLRLSDQGMQMTTTKSGKDYIKNHNTFPQSVSFPGKPRKLDANANKKRIRKPLSPNQDRCRIPICNTTV